MTKIKKTLVNLWEDESGQGATEYILLLVVVVGLAFIFKDKITQLVSSKMDQIGSDIGSFTSQ